MGRLPEDENAALFDPELEEQINGCLKKGLKRHRFPERLEKMYIEHYRKVRLKRFIWFGIIGLFFYNLFLIGDKEMLPDIFREAVILRLFIVTPLTIMTIAGFFIKRVAVYADFLAGCIILLGSVSILYLLILSESPNVNNYHTGLIIMIVVLNIVIRLKFRYAVFFTIIIFSLSVVAFHNISLMNAPTVDNSIMVLFTIAVFTLIGNYQIENENRFTYLNSLLRRINALKLEASNQKLQNISLTDALTGLANRRHLDTVLENEWKACCRSKEFLSLIFIDIDFFKNYNDNYGHQQGDDSLQTVAAELYMNVKRPRDVAARYGGEEFVVLLPGTDAAGAMKLAETLRQSVEALKLPHDYSEVASVVTVSLGVATFLPIEGNKCSTLIEKADVALYEAKKSGRNRIYLYPENG